MATDRREVGLDPLQAGADMSSTGPIPGENTGLGQPRPFGHQLRRSLRAGGPVGEARGVAAGAGVGALGRRVGEQQLAVPEVVITRRVDGPGQPGVDSGVHGVASQGRVGCRDDGSRSGPQTALDLGSSLVGGELDGAEVHDQLVDLLGGKRASAGQPPGGHGGTGPSVVQNVLHLGLVETAQNGRQGRSLPLDLGHETTIGVGDGVGGNAAHTARAVTANASLLEAIRPTPFEPFDPPVGGVVLASRFHQPVEGQNQ